MMVTQRAVVRYGAQPLTLLRAVLLNPLIEERHIRDLLADHARMASALAVVRGQLAPIAAGEAAELEEAAVRRLTSLYRGHIERENRELLPLAHRLLAQQDIGALSRAMTERRSRKD